MLDECYEGHHYKTARTFPADRRRMIPIMNLSDFSNDLLAMAEESITAIFGSYAGWHFVPREEKDNWTIESTRVRLMNEIRDNAIHLTGWPLLASIGCNVISPLFHHDGGGKDWILRDIPQSAFSPAMYRYSTGTTFPTITTSITKRGETSVYAKFTFSYGLVLVIPAATVKNAGLREGQLTNLVVEITQDGSRHPKPWVNLPDIGPYENYSEASSMAIFVEVLDPDSQKRDSIQLFCLKVLPIKRKKDCIIHEAFIKAMRIIQMLQGIKYTMLDETHFVREAYPVASMTVFDYDPLKGTADLRDLQYPLTERPAPRVLTYAENADRMFAGFPEFSIGLDKQPPWDFWREPEDNLPRGKKMRCDLCRHLMDFGFRVRQKCEVVEGEDHDAHTCQNTLELFNRPLTFTNHWESDKLWKEAPAMMRKMFPVKGHLERENGMLVVKAFPQEEDRTSVLQ